ncbi:hypothetical protein ACFOWZ_38560 [Lentzea rhizosphaerae]|uniref:Uncharacterized protein n=1 Tax=Lentzea rhizosphaerae TaxID=2041025 RepID=A0ABV8C618_9PSEU
MPSSITCSADGFSFTNAITFIAPSSTTLRSSNPSQRFSQPEPRTRPSRLSAIRTSTRASGNATRQPHRHSSRYTCWAGVPLTRMCAAIAGDTSSMSSGSAKNSTNRPISGTAQPPHPLRDKSQHPTVIRAAAGRLICAVPAPRHPTR